MNDLIYFIRINSFINSSNVNTLLHFVTGMVDGIVRTALGHGIPNRIHL